MAEVLTPPVSKSDAHRALLLSEICEGRHEALLPGAPPRDVEVLHRGLVQLRTGGGRIQCLDAGAPFRFLVTQAALRRRARFEFTGTARLGARPQRSLLSALERALPVTFTTGPDFWPLRLETADRGVRGPFVVAGDESSQFASSLVLGAARLVRDGHAPVVVELEGALTSGGYLTLTVDWCRRFGFDIEERPARVVVRGWRPTEAPTGLPGDWSSLTYLLPLSWRAGLPVAAVDRFAMHPDRAFAEVVERAGLSFSHEAGLTRMTGTLARGLEVDASVCPDAVPGLVAVALAAPAPSRFERCGVLRLKESDRLAGLAELVNLVGGRAEIAHDALTVTPPSGARAGAYDGRDDHRLVMAAAVAGALLEVPIGIHGTEAVEKSFPAFWREAAKAGVVRRESPGRTAPRASS